MEKIRYICNRDINRVKWDYCIEHSINTRIYAMTWYLDIVSEQWDCIVYGDYKLVFPVVFKSRYFFKKSYSPLFCQQLGFFTDDIDLINDHVLISDMVNCLKRRFKYSVQFSVTSEISSNIFNALKWGSSLEKRINIELSLNKDYLALYNSYSLNIKRKLKKNSIQMLSLKEASDVDFFINRFKKHVGLKVKLNQLNYKIISQIMNISIERGIGKLFIVLNKDSTIIASAFIISFQTRDILLFNYSDPQFKRLDAMTFLLDRYINKNASLNKILDFEGSNLEGVKRFYMSFGGLQTLYYLFSKSFFSNR
jgi:hypothetical protein